MYHGVPINWSSHESDLEAGHARNLRRVGVDRGSSVCPARAANDDPATRAACDLGSSGDTAAVPRGPADRNQREVAKHGAGRRDPTDVVKREAGASHPASARRVAAARRAGAGKPAVVAKRVGAGKRVDVATRVDAAKAAARSTAAVADPGAAAEPVPGHRTSRSFYRPPILLTSIAHTPRPCVPMTSMRSRGWTMKSMTATDGRLPPSTSHRVPPFVVTYTPKSFAA